MKSIISYPQRSNVLWCPTLVLLSPTYFLLLLSGNYGYDRNCWFQAKMRNNNEILLTELITRPCKHELSVRIDVVLNEAILHRSSSFFCNKILLQISDVAH